MPDIFARKFPQVIPEGLMDDVYSHLSIKVGARGVGTGEYPRAHDTNKKGVTTQEGKIPL